MRLGKMVLATLAAAFPLGLGSRASATTIAWSDFTDGVSSQTINGVQVAGFQNGNSAGNFLKRNWAGWDAVGIAGNAVDGEIDGLGNGESIKFTFGPGGVSIGAIEVAFLYTNGNYGDTVDETARFQVEKLDNTIVQFQLVADTATQGLYGKIGDPPVSVIPVSLGQNGYGGVWRVADPFGFKIKSLQLFPGSPSGNDASQSDYSFRELTMVPVPTAAWTGLGLMGILGVAKVRRNRE